MYPNISIASFQISTYSACMALSVIVCFSLIIMNRPRDFALTRPKLALIAFGYAMSAVLGAKILNIFLHANFYYGAPIIEIFRRAGYAYFGSIVFGLTAVWCMAQIYKMPFLGLLDYFAPYIILERVIGRTGCFFTGCCAGIPTNVPWAVTFKDGIGRHPAQLYEMSLALIIFIILYTNYPKLRKVSGATFYLAITLYGFGRFFNEFFRFDSPFVFGPLKLSHIATLLMFTAGLAGLLSKLKIQKSKRKTTIQNSKI